MKEMDWVDMLSNFFYKISIENMEKSEVEKPI